MSRVSCAIVVVGALLAGTATASAQAPPTQLDRIEHKLDLILHKLDQLQAGQPAGARPAPSPATAKPAAAPAGTTGATPAPETMAAGAVAIVHAAPANPVAARRIPTDSVGGFIYTGGTLHLADLSNRGVRYTGLTGVEWQGWLRTTETGRYELELDGSTVSVNNFTNSTCIFSGWLEDRSIGVQQAPPAPASHGPHPFPWSLVPRCHPVSTSYGSGLSARRPSPMRASRSRCWKRPPPISTCGRSPARISCTNRAPITPRLLPDETSYG